MLDWFAYDRDLGTIFVAPFDVRLSEHDTVQPDLLFVLAQHRKIVHEGRVVGGPDLVLEISSRSTIDRDLGDKRELYRTHGVAEYWFIDVEARTATVWALTDGEYVALPLNPDGRVQSRILAGFSVEIPRVFANADRQR